jgi:hypothetical protein
MARDNTGFKCHVHRSMVSFEVHHVWPKEYHGPDVKANKIKICCNAHSDIHFLMDHWLAGKPVNIHEFGPLIRYWAKKGYDQVIAYANSTAKAIEQEKGL